MTKIPEPTTIKVVLVSRMATRHLWEVPEPFKLAGMAK